jgi:hypothetical protein
MRGLSMGGSRRSGEFQARCNGIVRDGIPSTADTLRFRARNACRPMVFEHCLPAWRDDDAVEPGFELRQFGLVDALKGWGQ